MVALGLRRAAIDHALERGRLAPVHRGVYAVGHMALPQLANELAAVLACGEGTFLSHHWAAAVFGMRPGAEGDIEVTVVGRDAGRRRKGIRVHRVKGIDAVDVGRYENIPITAPARTLLDIAVDLDARELERAFDEALVSRLVSVRAVRAVLARYPRRRGSARLAALISGDRRTTMTRSQAEERFLALVRKARLPHPEVNVKVGSYEVDFLWRRELVVIEIDGYAFHSSRGAFERDHERDLSLKESDFEVKRFTWRQIVYEPELVLARLARALALSASGDRSAEPSPRARAE